MAFAPKSKKGVVIESSILVVLLLFVITTAYIAKELPNKSPKEPTGATAFEQQPEEAVLPEQLQETNQSQTSQTTDQQPTFSTQTDNQTTSSQEFGAATTLSSCGTITSPGSYQLSQNVSSTGTCFQIQTSDIELDCAGFTIEYGTTTTGIGINVSNGTTFLSNITIKNCEIRKDSTSGNNNYGVQLSRASNSSIFNNTISTNGGTNNYGIYINWYSHFNNITSNTIASKGTGGSNIGIYQEDYSNSSNIAYNTILTNGTFGNHGILLLRSENSNITFNIIRTEGSSSSNLGIVMSTSTLNTNASNNVISTKGTTNNYGIWITNNQRNIAKNNNITTNGSSTGQQGIRIDGTASNSTISGNRIITGGTGSSYGIALIESTKDNIISSNNITTSSVGNNNNGIFLESISGENAGNMFSENEISTTANASHGILIKNSQNNTFSNNRVNVVNETSSEWRTETPTTPGSRNNTAINLTLVRNNITIHLTAFNGTEVKAVTTSEAASLGTPPGPNNKSLGKFTNITNSTGNAWLFINITYTDEEVAAAGIVESTLRIWRYNGTAWTNESFFAPGQYGVDTTNNFVFANITGFSTYGVFGAEFIELSSCGDITSSGRYKLIQNVSNGGTCFNINASNVELDCAGFTITYGTTTSGKGINVSSESSLLNDIAIKNCNIQKGAGGGDNNHGIQLESTSNSLIFNNTIATDGGQYNNGIRVSTSTNSNITLNTIRTNGVLSEYGINFYATNNSKITNNIIITNGSGSGNIGIAVFASFIGNEINNNRISTYGTYNNFGIFLSNSNSHIITNNNLTTNGSSTDQYGIYLDNSNNSTISGNIISTGGGLVTLGSAIGFLLTSSSNNTILSNLIKTSEKGYYNDGIHVMSNSNGNTFLENNITTTTFTSHGIIIQNAQNNTFNNNRVNVTNETSSEWRTETPTTPGSRNNTAINLTLVRNNITIHLTAFNGTEVKAVTTSEAASLGTPPGPNNKSLGKFANITNSTGNAWLFINITYTDEEVAAAGIVESTLRIWRYNGTAWTNESFFAPGQYGVDTTNNFVFANITGFSTYGVFGATPDTTPPSVFDPKPEPNSAFNTATTIEIAVNATDNVAVDKVYANITLPNGTQQQLSLTPATGSKYNNSFTIPTLTGLYNITYFANDTSGNANTTTTTNFTATNQAPSITLYFPLNNTQFNNTQTVTFNFSAIDDLNTTLSCGIYLDNILNQTNSTTQNNTVTEFTIEGISFGSHTWFINCTDGSLSNTSETRIFIIADTQAPGWSNNKTFPTSPATYSPTQTYQFNITWTDNTALDTVLFEHNFTGVAANYSPTGFTGNTTNREYFYNYGPLAAGNYYWKSHANDTSGNTNSTATFSYTVNKATPTLNITLQPSSSVTYGTTTNASCTASTPQITPQLFRNGTLVSNPDVGVLAAGSYNYTCTATETQNYTAPTPQQAILTINKAASEINLLLNGNDANITATQFSIVNITTKLITPASGLIDLFENGTLLSSGSSPLEVLKNYTTIGTYNITAVFNSTENYTSSFETHFLRIIPFQDTTPPTITSTSIKPKAAIVNRSVTINATASDDFGVDTLFAIVTKPDSTNTTITLPAIFVPDTIGRYNVTFKANDSSGNNATPIEDFFTASEPLNFTINVKDGNQNPINTTLAYLSLGTNEEVNITTFIGNQTIEQANTTFDLLFVAFNETLQARLNSVNLTENNNKTLGLDKLPTPVSGYLVSYALNNGSINFASAELRFSYANTSFSNEDNLKLDVCEEWNFTERSCIGSFTNAPNATQNKTGDYFTVNVTSFSGFSIKEEAAPSGGRGRREEAKPEITPPPPEVPPPTPPEIPPTPPEIPPAPTFEAPAPITQIFAGTEFSPNVPSASCMQVRKKVSEKIEMTPIDVTKLIAIPEGYEVIDQFRIECLNDDLEVTLNLPDYYTDLKALGCRANQCKEIARVISERMEIICGEKTISAIKEEQLGFVKEVLRPFEYTLIPSNEKTITPQSRIVASNGNAIEFVGDIQVIFTAKISSPTMDIPQPANPSATIVGSPVLLSLDKKPSIALKLSVPAPSIQGFDEESLAIYALKGRSWERLETTQDAATKTLSAFVPNITELLDTNNNAIFAVIGIKCKACIEPIFDKPYELPGSRRALVLVPGLFAEENPFGTLIDEFRYTRQPWQIWRFAYPPKLKEEVLARKLAASLEQHNLEYDSIYLAGHSFGGILIQDALNIAKAEKHAWLGKVKKVILVGTPNEGSPTLQVYKSLFDALVNLRTGIRLFDVDAENVKLLAEQKPIERVPGINYQVIAGTKPFDFTKHLFAEQEKNDGIITTRSAQRIGDVYMNDSCRNYYEINLTHIALNDNPLALRVLSRIINKEIASEEKARAFVGYNQYFKISIDRCSPEDNYIIIGKRLRDEKLPDPINCACGNGWCGLGEDAENCPSDCAVLFTTEKTCEIMPIIVELLLIVLVSAILASAWIGFIDLRPVPGLKISAQIAAIGVIVASVAQFSICRDFSIVSLVVKVIKMVIQNLRLLIIITLITIAISSWLISKKKLLKNKHELHATSKAVKLR